MRSECGCHGRELKNSLHVASKDSSNLDTLTLLLENGGAKEEIINGRDHKRNTPLDHVYKRGYDLFVKAELIKRESEADKESGHRIRAQ